MPVEDQFENLLQAEIAKKTKLLIECRDVLKEVSIEMHHARTFIDTRERIFTMGLMQYDETLQKLEALLAKLES